MTFIIEDEEWFYDRIVDQPFQSPEDSTEAVSNKASKQSWARLIQKVYEVDPLVCPKCSHKMRIVAVITDPFEVTSSPPIRGRASGSDFS